MISFSPLIKFYNQIYFRAFLGVTAKFIGLVLWLSLF